MKFYKFISDLCEKNILMSKFINHLKSNKERNRYIGSIKKAIDKC